MTRIERLAEVEIIIQQTEATINIYQELLRHANEARKDFSDSSNMASIFDDPNIGQITLDQYVSNQGIVYAQILTNVISASETVNQVVTQVIGQVVDPPSPPSPPAIP
jgi:hypothetical protein